MSTLSSLVVKLQVDIPPGLCRRPTPLLTPAAARAVFHQDLPAEWHYLSPCCLSEVRPVRLGYFRCDGCEKEWHDSDLLESDDPALHRFQVGMIGDREARRIFGILDPQPVNDETIRRLHELGQDVRRRAGY